ncbi:Glf UDP-galactopyranose mutase [uncultured Caudovirales phage]|uniref:Glf UDP-galactopyranose mutase n=1 Tax=uncultured Caudovirales phage TaxID=2100421 RepID=A0A6J7WXG2_9CAUD|nr:Glf UDP-galactopyranose mutase [uncultured Caudovirales phage]
MYDYLIVGAGMFGATFARLATDAGKTCLVIDKRDHIAGNCYTENKEGIHIHKYGPHIFHTSNDAIWKFVNRFARFNNFVLSPKANYKGKLYSLPFNMNTFYELWKTITPEQAKAMIAKQVVPCEDPKTLEEFALSTVGKDVYNTLIKGYTEKQWMKHPRDLPASIIKRLPLRFTYNSNYFNDKYQGIPIGGYTEMFELMLEGIDVELNIDYFANKQHLDSLAKKVVYTGCIDQYFDYKYGKLEYRTLDFETARLDIESYQGTAVVNYTGTEQPFTRIVEHKHFDSNPDTTPYTYITHEYPAVMDDTKIPYYPINDEKNQSIFNLYDRESKLEKNVIFGGRLANYQYYDMHQVIGQAMATFSKQEVT